MSAKLSKREVKEHLEQLAEGEHFYEVTVTLRFASKISSLEDAVKSVTSITDTIHADRRANGHIHARRYDELDT